MSNKLFLEIAAWDPTRNLLKKPAVNKSGKGKTVYLISEQLNRKLTIATPSLLSYGIADYVDQSTGLSDNRYTISLQMPGEASEDADAKLFLQKMKDFENAILDAAVANSTQWWGRSMTRDMVEFTYTPVLKYPKTADGLRPDHNKAPTIRAKVYGTNAGQWEIEIFDSSKNQIFPAEGVDASEGLHPKDFVPKNSRVRCVLECTGVWFAGQGWGVTWKCIQVIVTPPETYRLIGSGRCLLDCDDEGTSAASLKDAIPAPMGANSRKRSSSNEAAGAPASKKSDMVTGVIVNDSDDESSPAAPAAPVAAAPVAAAPVAAAPVTAAPAAAAPVAAAPVAAAPVAAAPVTAAPAAAAPVAAAPVAAAAPVDTAEASEVPSAAAAPGGDVAVKKKKIIKKTVVAPAGAATPAN